MTEAQNDILPFKCLQCGTCCRWEGYVRIGQSEIDAIAEYLDMSVADFLTLYTRLTHDRTGLSLIEKHDGSCVFYEADSGVCQINDVKPIQCRNFPLLWNFAGWEKECAWGKQNASR